MIQICLLTYNRSDLIGNTIESILLQELPKFELLISDNSTDNVTQNLIETKYSQDQRVRYIKRTTSLPAIDHFNKVLSEVTAEYFMLFHDDDIMLPQMIQNLYDTIQRDESIVAVGCNAWLNKNNKRKGAFRNAKQPHTIISNRSELISQYLGKNGCVPFPSYIYRRSKLEGLFMDIEKGGKYCDVSFLMSVCDRGKMIWLNQSLMNYYIHKGQDSQSNNFTDCIKLVKHITTTTVYNPQDKIVKRFRLLNIYRELKTNLEKKQEVSFIRIISMSKISLKLYDLHLFMKFNSIFLFKLLRLF